MKVEIWSDIACPWCYIGRRRFETALKQTQSSQTVEIVWRSFQLDPDAPITYPGTLNDMLMHKYGLSSERVEAMQAQVLSLAAAEGLFFNFDAVQQTNTFDAHRLLHLAASSSHQNALKERLQKAYFCDGALVSDHGTLIQLAAEVGMNTEDARSTLANPRSFAAEVRSDQRKAQALGINGVPFFVLNGRFGVSGAQSVEVFVSAIHRVAA